MSLSGSSPTLLHGAEGNRAVALPAIDREVAQDLAGNRPGGSGRFFPSPSAPQSRGSSKTRTGKRVQKDKNRGKSKDPFLLCRVNGALPEAQGHAKRCMPVVLQVAGKCQERMLSRREEQC